MRKVLHLLLFFVTINVAAALHALAKQKVAPGVAIEGYSQRIETSVSSVPEKLLQNSYQRGEVKVVATALTVPDHKIRDYYRRHAEAPDSSTTYWKFRQPHFVTATSTAVDRQYYFVNSYLVGFQPFAVDALWQPFYTVATHKTYLKDSAQYGLNEIWQNSAQAYLNTRGDCEDHALLLTDWLIESGVDARVVLGDYKGEGHAWVVAFMEGEAFLLEATSKRRHRSWNAYPKTVLSTGYQPRTMFNREKFWVNTGSRDSRDYSGSQWQLASTFHPAREAKGL